MKNTPLSPKRRQVLIWGGLSVFAGSIAAYLGLGDRVEPSLSGPESPAPSIPDERAVTFAPSSPVEITHEGIDALLNSEFTLDRADEPAITGILVEITPKRRLHGPSAEYDAFSLVFTAKSDFPKDGAICRISHPQLIPSEVFLTPVGRPVEGKVLLEAAFSLRV